MILVCKGTCDPVAPLFKGQGGSGPGMHPRSGAPGLNCKHILCDVLKLNEPLSSALAGSELIELKVNRIRTCWIWFNSCCQLTL